MSRKALPSVDAVRISSLVVRRDRVCADVRVAPFARTTTPQIAARALQAFPSIAQHACVNEKGGTFGLVIEDTPLPHLMEHLVIALQMLADGSSAREGFTYVGTTEWANEAEGKARIEVNFADDLVCLRAFRDAAGFLNEAVDVAGLFRLIQPA